jgi:PAS domain S-box-containing protein
MDVTKRERAEQRLQIQYAISRILAGSSTLAEATPKILKAICQITGWEVGAIWSVDQGHGVLRCLDVWHAPGVRVRKFDAVSRASSFPRGIGLPGRVWQRAAPTWIPDITKDDSFPRAPAATKEGLRAAFAFPVRLGKQVMGVVEFFSREIRAPDEALLKMVETIGHQIGQFWERRRAERELRESEVRKGAMLEAALDCILIIDDEDRIVEWNPAAEKTFGRARAEVLGQKVSELILPPALRERHYQSLERYVESKHGALLGRRVEMTAMRADGTEFPIELALTRTSAEGPPIFMAYLRDITERRRAEESLRASAAEFRAVFELAGSGKCQTDPATGRFLRVNRKLCDIAGYSREELLGLTFAQITHPDDREGDLEQFHRLVAGELSEYSMEKRYLRKDGKVVWVHSTTTLIRDAVGRPLRTVGVVQDIDYRKLIEQTLRETEARFRQLADAMPQIVWTAQADGTVDYYNKRWYEFTGLQEDQSLEQSWRLVLHRDDVASWDERWAHAVKSGEPYQLECRFLDRQKGAFRWFLARALPSQSHHGQIVRWHGTCTDIDQQKRGEERFVRLNETLVAVLEAFPDIVFVVDNEGRIEFKNPAAGKFASATGIDDRLPPPIQSELEQVIQTGKHHLPTSFKEVHRVEIHDEERYFLSRVVTMTAPNNTMFGAVVLLQDVTEFRLLDQVKTNLISTVSHELKTPITSLRTALHVLLDQSIGTLNARQSEMAIIARDEAERLLRTLDSLLDLTRFEEGAVGMRLERITPVALVQAAVEATRVAAASARVTIRLELDEDLPALAVDRERIIHVLTNLMTNAIKYSPEESELVVRASKHTPGTVSFSIMDKGPGVPRQYQSRIFEKFFRVPGDSRNGAGLGLSIAREFIRAHRGRIGVRSEPGQGSEFYFILSSEEQ